MDDERCAHGVPPRHGCVECIGDWLADRGLAREDVLICERDAISEYCGPEETDSDADTGEIAMTAAEYAAFRERAAGMFGTPGWESPELRALEANE